ncbi:ABC transporter substrate-binding protein [Nocardia sp. CDC159]|uniref:ABC transporter substrate-binding protein n=1 Tax=Nocardia pulmonis TaxID=2951408 RepID=A0A9X2IWV0_9NOCA|nr:MULTISPECIES: ABC transporter substrate-binding protein [Nocardia]MCM6774728.1 ABC transporter substrate-binding protein [Nocardia pulmonis]MCM6787207.1 ABC transporter substrate-binding protein [Nocardia sp. CDC159]
MKRIGLSRRILAVLGAGLAVVLAAGACGGGSSPQPAAGDGLEKTRLTVGAVQVLDDAPLFIAIKEGYFQQEGLTVDTKLVTQSTQALPDLLHGTIDLIGGGNLVSYLQGNARGTFDLQVLGTATTCVADGYAIMALPDSNVRTPADLADKKIAVAIVNNIQTLTADVLLKSAGIDTTGIRYVQIPFPDMNRALAARQVDAISVVEPFVTSAKREVRAVSVMSQCSGPTENLPLSGYFATRSWTQQNPKAARAFQRALARAQEHAAADHAAVHQIIPSYTNISPQDAQQLALGGYPPTTDPAQLQRVADLMHSGGMLSEPLDVNPIIFR